MIDGVRLKQLQVIPDQRGYLTELLRADDPDFIKFGQLYTSVTYPQVVKAWHLHRRQTDSLVCLTGMILLALYDDRPGSATRGELQELYLGPLTPERVSVPPGVYHGWKCISAEPALVLNVSSELYDHDSPDALRIPPHGGSIPYDWTRHDG